MKAAHTIVVVVHMQTDRTLERTVVDRIAVGQIAEELVVFHTDPDQIVGLVQIVAAAVVRTFAVDYIVCLVVGTK